MADPESSAPENDPVPEDPASEDPAPEDAGSDASDAGSSTLRRVAIWSGGLLGGLLVLMLVVALLVPYFFTSERLKGYVIPPMEETTGRQVQIDDIGLRILLRPAVRVSGFQLSNAEGFGDEPAVEAGQLNVEVALWPLFSGGIEPTAVELVDPVIRYQVAEDGTTNFDDLASEEDTTTTEEDEGAALTIPVSNFRTSGAQLRYTDESTGQALELDFGAQLSALPQPDGALTSAGTVDITALKAVLPDVQEDTMQVTDARIDYDVRAALADGQVDLSTFTVETAPVTVSTTGSIQRLNTRPAVDLTIETTEADLSQLAAFAPAAAVEGVNPQGTIELTTTVQGVLPDSTGSLDSLSVDGTGRLAGVGVDYEGDAMLRDLSADLALTLDRFSLQSIDGTLLGSSLTGQLAVADPMGEPEVDLDLETGTMNVADLAALAPPEQVEGYNPQGTVQITVAVQGAVPEDSENLDQLSVDGSGQLADIGIDYEGTALLRSLGASLAFTSTSATVGGINGQLLGEPLEGEITVNDLMGAPRVDGSLAGAADIAELMALAPEETTAEMPDIQGRTAYDVHFAGPVDDPDAIQPNGTVRLTDVRYPYESFRHPIEIPEATVQLTGTGISMDRFPLRSGDQQMALQTTIRNLFPISEGMAETNPTMAVDFTFSSDRLDLVELYPEEDEATSEVTYADLFSASLSGSTVNGQSPEALAKELYGDVELPEYTIDGRVEIATFLNPPQRIDDLAMDLQLQDQVARVRNLSGTMYEGQLAGGITFDQSGTSTSSRSAPDDRVLMAATEVAPAPASASRQAFDLDYDVRLSGAEASAFLEDWTSLGRVVNGSLNLSVTGNSPLSEGLLPLAEALAANGNARVADGGLSMNLGPVKALVNTLGLEAARITEFQQFGGSFTIENGAMQIDDWPLSGQQTNARLSGMLGLDGSLDVDFRMDLPMSVLQSSKIPGRIGGDGNLGRLVQTLAGGDNSDTTVPLKVSLGGTMSNPAVQVLDQAALRSTIQKLVKEQVKEEGAERLRNLFDSGERE